MEKGHINRTIAIEIISFLFVLLFAYAGFTKALDYSKFAMQIDQSPILTGFGKVLPWAVIGGELSIAGMLFYPRLRLVGFFLAFSLMTMFTAYIIAILNFSSYIPCSCGGILEKLSWRDHLVFNIVFTLLSVAGIVLQDQFDNKRIIS